MNIRIRTMTDGDIPHGMRLKELAGWNQTPADWQRFLQANPNGCFVAECDYEVRGTVATIIYEGRFAWIGMLLVDPDYRGRGLGTRLLEKAIEHLDAVGLPTAKLDATPQGKRIYEKLGFVAEYEIERWVLRRAAPNERPLEPVTPSQLELIAALDREVFGADRSSLLRSLHQDAPHFTLSVTQRGKVLGYALGRHGSRADHLGPWMSSDEQAAGLLLDDFLRRSQRDTVFVDILKTHPSAQRLVELQGFIYSRPLTRMLRGPNRHSGRPEQLCAILGPEFG